MTHPPVEHSLLESHRCVFNVIKIEPHLAQSEQVEVVDEKRSVKHEPPACGRNTEQQDSPESHVNPPDNLRQRFPLPVHQEKKQADYQHIHAPLDWFRNDRLPP